MCHLLCYQIISVYLMLKRYEIDTQSRIPVLGITDARRQIGHHNSDENSFIRIPDIFTVREKSLKNTNFSKTHNIFIKYQNSSAGSTRKLVDNQRKQKRSAVLHSPIYIQILLYFGSYCYVKYLNIIILYTTRIGYSCLNCIWVIFKTLNTKVKAQNKISLSLRNLTKTKIIISYFKFILNV